MLKEAHGVIIQRWSVWSQQDEKDDDDDKEFIYGKESKKPLPNPKLCNHSLKDIDWRRGQDKAIYSNWNITDHLNME